MSLAKLPIDVGYAHHDQGIVRLQIGRAMKKVQRFRQDLLLAATGLPGQFDVQGRLKPQGHRVHPIELPRPQDTCLGPLIILAHTGFPEPVKVRLSQIPGRSGMERVQVQGIGEGSLRFLGLRTHQPLRRNPSRPGGDVQVEPESGTAEEQDNDDRRQKTPLAPDLHPPCSTGRQLSKPPHGQSHERENLRDVVEKGLKKDGSHGHGRT